MEQEKIKYSEVLDLGFTEDEQIDKIYFNEHGFEYCIITMELTKKIYLDWDKETQLCKLVRIDSPKHCNIKAELPIRNLEHLKEIINFFSDDVGQSEQLPCDCSKYATYFDEEQKPRCKNCNKKSWLAR